VDAFVDDRLGANRIADQRGYLMTRLLEQVCDTMVHETCRAGDCIFGSSEFRVGSSEQENREKRVLAA